jgi:hypothetical protein
MVGWWCGKEQEGNGQGPIEVLSRHLIAGTDEIHKNLVGIAGVWPEIRTEHPPEIQVYHNQLHRIQGLYHNILIHRANTYTPDVELQ